ncbi:MAG: hypothetical protein ACRDYE_14380 [Acidimicrobiales bacterium]
MMVTVDLVERSGSLKDELFEFSAKHRYDEARGHVLMAHGVHAGVADEGKLINPLDDLLLLHRLDNGQTIVELFVAARPALSTPTSVRACREHRPPSSMSSFSSQKP